MLSCNFFGILIFSILLLVKIGGDLVAFLFCMDGEKWGNKNETITGTQNVCHVKSVVISIADTYNI